MDATTSQVLSILIILLTLVIIAVPVRRRYALRPIAAYKAVPMLSGLSIESSQPLHVSFGSAGIGGQSTLLTLASAEFAYHLHKQTASADVSPLMTVADASALPVAQDSLRRAFHARRMVSRYKAQNVHWYPSGSRSLAFVAAITGLIHNQSLSSNVMLGSFGPELALVLDASHRRGLPSIGVSDQLEGQAVAFAMADYPLIGEEIFFSAAYLDDNIRLQGKVITMDILRWGLIATILLGFGLKLVQGT